MSQLPFTAFCKQFYCGDQTTANNKILFSIYFRLDLVFVAFSQMLLGFYVYYVFLNFCFRKCCLRFLCLPLIYKQTLISLLFYFCLITGFYYFFCFLFMVCIHHPFITGILFCSLLFLLSLVSFTFLISFTLSNCIFFCFFYNLFLFFVVSYIT